MIPLLIVDDESIIRETIGTMGESRKTGEPQPERSRRNANAFSRAAEMNRAVPRRKGYVAVPTPRQGHPQEGARQGGRS